MKITKLANRLRSAKAPVISAGVIAANADQVAAYRGGNEKLFGFFVGQVMKASAGKANPKIVNEILRSKL